MISADTCGRDAENKRWRFGLSEVNQDQSRNEQGSKLKALRTDRGGIHFQSVYSIL
jgi:hypothetical protein